jgi:hypothetical protein
MGKTEIRRRYRHSLIDLALPELKKRLRYF